MSACEGKLSDHLDKTGKKILFCALSSNRIGPLLLTVLARMWFNGRRYRKKMLLLLKSQEMHGTHFRKFAFIIGSNLPSCIEYWLEEIGYQVIFGANILVLSPQRNLVQTVWETSTTWVKFQYLGTIRRLPSKARWWSELQLISSTLCLSNPDIHSSP